MMISTTIVVVANRPSHADQRATAHNGAITAPTEAQRKRHVLADDQAPIEQEMLERNIKHQKWNPEAVKINVKRHIANWRCTDSQ